MVNNCFDSNLVGVAAAAAYTAQFMAVGNYGNGTVGATCPFAGKYDDPQRFELNAPLCSNYDATECGISSTYSPIATPTATPITSSPSFPVTEYPTSSTDKPTARPSRQPSPKPSKKATSFPTGSSATRVSVQVVMTFAIAVTAICLL
jgi:hypothetical protein